ncbi:hypothetical protein [Methylomonas albis]|nr:hypothetical protein [Methylomonas albis]
MVSSIFSRVTLSVTAGNLYFSVAVWVAAFPLSAVTVISGNTAVKLLLAFPSATTFWAVSAALNPGRAVSSMAPSTDGLGLSLIFECFMGLKIIKVLKLRRFMAINIPKPSNFPFTERHIWHCQWGYKLPQKSPKAGCVVLLTQLCRINGNSLLVFSHTHIQQLVSTSNFHTF